MEKKELCGLCALKLNYNIELSNYNHHKETIASYQAQMQKTGREYLGSHDGVPFYSYDEVDHSITENFLGSHQRSMMFCKKQLENLQQQIDNYKTEQ